MKDAEGEAGLYLALLRSKIRQLGCTPQQIQQSLGWDPSHLRGLERDPKSLRMDQVFQILDVLGIEPGEFFGELYGSSQEVPS